MIVFAALQSVRGHDVEFTSAFGRAAEMHGRTASAAFDANIQSCLSTANFAVMHNRPYGVLGYRCRLKGALRWDVVAP
jgi:hypothetical protein